MKTLFVWFFINIVGILCYAQEINYSNNDILKLNIMNNATDKNISSKIPEVIAKYILTRKNNIPLTENSRTSIIWNNLFGNYSNVKDVNSTKKLGDLKIIKSMPYKYVEVIHYVPVKVTTTSGGKKVILDANSNSDNMRKVLVNNDNLSNIRNIIVNENSSNDMQRNIISNGVFEIQKTVINKDGLNKNDLNGIQKVIVSNNNYENLQKLVYKDGLSKIQEHKLNVIDMPKIVEDKENVNIVSYKDNLNRVYDILANKSDLNNVQASLMNLEGLHKVKPNLENKIVTDSQKDIINENNLNNLKTNRLKQDDLPDIDKVQNENLNDLQKVIVSMENPNKEQIVFINNDSEYLNNMPKFDELNKIQETTESKDVLNNTENVTEENSVIENINKDTLLTSLGYFVRHSLKSDNPKNKVIFKVILDYFLKYLEKRGLSSREILKYLQRRREDTNTGLEVLSMATTNNQNNDNDYTKVVHFNDNIHNNLKHEDVMRAIDKEILINNFDDLVHNLPNKEDAFKFKEIYILILRDFRKYLELNGIGDSEILEYLQQTQNAEPSESIKATRRQQIVNNDLTSINTNDEIMTTKSRNVNDSIILKEATFNLSDENVQNHDDNNATISIENLVGLSQDEDTKRKLNYLQTQEMSQKVADAMKPRDKNFDDSNLYRTLNENVKIVPIKSITQNLDDKIIMDIDKTTESQTLSNMFTLDEVEFTTNLPIINDKETNNDNELGLNTEKDNQVIKNEEVDRLKITTDKEDGNIKMIEDIIIDNETNIDTLRRSSINIPNDELNKHNQIAEYENIPLVSVTPNVNPEYNEALTVPKTTENILNMPRDIANDGNINNNYKLNDNENIFEVTNNKDFTDLWKSEKPNLTSIFDIKSPKIGNLDTEDKFTKGKDFYLRQDNTDFVNLSTSEKPNLTSLFDVTTLEVNNFDLNTDNENKLSSNDNNNIKDNKDFIDVWTSEKPNLTSIFDIESPKLEEIDTNNDKEVKIEEPNYNTDHINKIQNPTNEITDEIIKLREVLSKLIVILQLIFEKINLNKLLLNNNLINKLLKSLLRNHQINIKSNLNLEPNDFVIEKFKFLNTILPIIRHSQCNHDYLVHNHSDDINKVTLTNDYLENKLLLLLKLLQFKDISFEQILKIIEISLLNMISSVTDLNYNLQLALCKSLLSILN